MVIHGGGSAQLANDCRWNIPIRGEVTEGQGREFHLPGWCYVGPAPNNTLGCRSVLPQILHAVQHGSRKGRNTPLCEFTSLLINSGFILKYFLFPHALHKKFGPNKQLTYDVVLEHCGYCSLPSQ